MAKDDVLIQRVGTALEMYPETADNDTALAFRVALLYGASFAMDAEKSLSLPSCYRIKKAKKLILEGGHHNGRTAGVHRG